MDFRRKIKNTKKRNEEIIRLHNLGVSKNGLSKLFQLTTSMINIITNNRSRYEDKSVWAGYHRAYRLKNREKIRAYKREYNTKWRKENGYHNEAMSKRRYPEKEYARYITQQAVRTGKLVKQVCKCGNPSTEAHHVDYSKPMEVVWLCRSCHSKEHVHKYAPVDPMILEQLKQRYEIYKKEMEKKKERNQEIITLRNQGFTLREIGDKCGLTHQRVQQICKKSGL